MRISGGYRMLIGRKKRCWFRRVGLFRVFTLTVQKHFKTRKKKIISQSYLLSALSNDRLDCTSFFSFKRFTFAF